MEKEPLYLVVIVYERQIDTVIRFMEFYGLRYSIDRLDDNLLFLNVIHEVGAAQHILNLGKALGR